MPRRITGGGCLFLKRAIVTPQRPCGGECLAPGQEVGRGVFVVALPLPSSPCLLWRTWMGMEFSEIHVIVLVVAGFLFIISLFARLKASTDEE